MKLKSFKERKQKWEEKNKDLKAIPSREATLVLTVENALKLLRKQRKGKLLDIGCGLGEIDILLAQKTNFEIIVLILQKEQLKLPKKMLEKQVWLIESRLRRGISID